ncbi:hypothetical protein MMC32_007733 [Xylographa parallela]|nr:hypothetical protein [Xylographa parallela]
MIGTSFKEYAFIRACIFFLHYIAPLSIACCVLTLLIRHSGFRIPKLLEIIAVAETSFYLFVYLPRRHYLQHAAIHPTTLSRDERQRLFRLCHENVPDAELYLRKWFNWAPITDIKRENVKEFFCWALLNKGAWGPEDEEELEQYADSIGELLGRTLEPGRGPAKPLRLTLDKVNMMHRSLIWYCCVAVVDTITYCSMLFYGFQFHRLRLSRTLTVFPFRPITLTSSHKTPAKTISYWHRPHTSKNRLPVLFIHGIGIGLYPYVNFLAKLNCNEEDEAPDGQMGVIAIEMMPVSFRITSEMPEKDQMCEEILQIVNKHHWEKFVLVSHSYGSVISTHLLKHRKTASRIGPVLLVDPVSFLLHLPDVAYNFTCRPPRRANEHQLYYFASMDMGVSHTLARRFFWSENILWREDIDGRQLSVALSGQDLIVDTQAVGRYLANGHVGILRDEEWQERPWKGEGLDVLWFQHKDHAQIFDTEKDYKRLIRVVRNYSLIKD